jgi:hypothetical protein
MARGSCQKQFFLVSEAIFSLVAIEEVCMVLLKVIKLIKTLFVSERPQNDALANPPILVPNTPRNHPN